MKYRWLILFLGICGLVFQMHSAVAPHSEEEMTKNATLIVEGKVRSVTSKSQKSIVERGLLLARDRVHSIQIQINSVEKGKAKTGEEITFKAWKPSTRIPPLPGPQGHSSIPKQGDSVKVYLQGDEKSYQPFMPNGIEILQKAAPKK
jgi:hypothetical protein